MTGKRYLSWERVSQLADRGHSVSSVTLRLDVSTKSLYEWVGRYGKPDSERNQPSAQQQGIRALRFKLKRVTEERDILKMAAAYFAKESR